MIIFFISSTTFAVRGVVVHYKYSSDKIIIKTSMGYTCGEVYGGFLVDEGHILNGELENYGFKDIYDLTIDDTIRIWIDEYWLSKNEALRWLGN